MFNDNVFFSDFADPIEIDGRPYVGIYDRKQYQSTDGLTMTSTISIELLMFSRDIAESGTVKGTEIMIRGVNHKVYDLYDDGLGMTTVYLQVRR